MTGEVVCGYRLLRGLGARALPAYAAVDPKPGSPARALCVVEQLAREADVSAEAAAEFLRDAKRLAQVRHPNLVQVRDVVVGASTVLLVTDWVEAETLAEIEKGCAAKGTPFPLAVSLRILVDLLEGLSAFHELRDAKREPLRLVHAEVAPRNVLVGVDGRSVLAHPLRAPSAAARGSAPDAAGYLAPEVLLGDQTADQRADVYGAGIILWEALMGRRMHADGEDVGEIVMRILGGKIEAPAAPADAPWAAPLAEAARRATAPDPSVRFANATEMLAELRRSIGARLAAKTQIASIVETVAGEHIRERRRALDVKVAEKTDVLPARQDTPSVVVLTAPGERAEQGETPRVSAAAAAIDVPPSSTIPVDVDVDVVSAKPAAPESLPPSSADVVEVIEMEVPPDRPSRPRAPPPLRPRAAAAPQAPAFPPPPGPMRPPSGSKTDVGSLALVSTPAIPLTPEASQSRARASSLWALIGLGALALLCALWFFTRRGPEPTDSAETPSPSSTVSTTQAPLAAPAPARSADAPAAVASASPHAEPSEGADPSPFEPPIDKPAPPPRAPGKEAAPFPSSPPATPAPLPAPAPAPASSSPHPKKRVYDPQGI